MGMGTLLIACPSCSCHAFARETQCPACGSALRAADGSIQRTAGAVMLGLTLVASTAACGSDVDGGSGGGGGQGGMAVTSTAISAYGVGPGGGFSSTMSGSPAVSAYGVGPGGGFSTVVTGAGGTGGTGGASGTGGAGGTGG